MSQTNTLFSYFKKSPKVNETSLKNDNTPSSKDVNRRNGHSPLTKTSKRQVKLSLDHTPKTIPVPKKKVPDELNQPDLKVTYKLYDVVWAKIDGYPWWPGLICISPDESDKGLYSNGDKKNLKFHVQFFDNPPTRAWIKIKYLKSFKGPTHSEVPPQKDIKWKDSVERALEANEKTADERSYLVAKFDHKLDIEEVNDEIDDEEATPIGTTKKRQRIAETLKEPKRRRVVVLSDDSGSDEDFKPNLNESRESDCSVHSAVGSEDDSAKGPKRTMIVVFSEDSDSEEEVIPNLKDANESDCSVHSAVDSEVESPAKTTTKRKKATPTANKRNKKAQPVERHISKKKPDNLKEATIKKLADLSQSTPEKINHSFSKLSSPNESTKSPFSRFGRSESLDTSVQECPEKVTQEKNWAHLNNKHDWLRDDKRRDSKGHPQNHPDYNPRTLYIPEHFKKTVSPAQKQWWEFKSQYFDTVLFFKVGKFYELYHMDAVIAVNELGISYMKGEVAHAGFPEKAYGRFSEMLIQKGYKVARIEQTETPQQLEERNRVSRGAKDKVVRRELCKITTKGTRTFSFIDGDSGDFKSNYLLALTETYIESEDNLGQSIYGVCFIDTSIGKFMVGQFTDDRNCSRLRTLIAHHPPTQVLFEKSAITSKTHNILNNCLASALKEPLRSISEFWDSTKTLKFLVEGNYFVDDKILDNSLQWPTDLKKMLDPEDCLHQTAAKAYDLAIRSLGACIWYLKMCLIEEELITMKSFQEYIPPDKDVTTNIESLSSSRIYSKHMVLDGVTLANLELLENESGHVDGTLLNTMNFCCTPFGKRLFRQWLCSPLCNPNSINDRLNAIEDLETVKDLLEDVTTSMKKLPDLERLLSKIHTQGSANRSQNHPDCRAVFFEEIIYSRKKISDFVITLQGFKTCLEIIHLLNDSKIALSSTLLTRCLKQEEDGGCFPDIKSNLSFFDNAFDHEKARKEGKIMPSQGVDQDFDEADSTIKAIINEFQSHLEEQSRYFGCKVNYFGTGKNRYQLEVPDAAARRATSNHDLQSQKKNFKRYWTPEIKDLLARLTSAEDEREIVLKDIMRRIFSAFDDEKAKWKAALECISILDVLISLTHYKSNSSVPMCRPEVLIPQDDQEPFLEIREGQHPTLMKVLDDNDFIPNDILIGPVKDEEDQSSLVLVTGPNMGGKSTLMREAGLLVIMAQMGSFVPADICRFTIVDRIFTRLGASDRIIEGESTFYVELSETASILQHATPDSLILLDELGRGTATYDGTAIAYAVVKELSENKFCRTLFSTHYHCLVDEFQNNSKVKLGHMSCMVENENEEDPTQETITFLYKFASGACPKSYGFNVAMLAGIPDSVIRLGYEKAKEFEQSVNQIKELRAFLNCNNMEQLREIQRHM